VGGESQCVSVKGRVQGLHYERFLCYGAICSERRQSWRASKGSCGMVLSALSGTRVGGASLPVGVLGLTRMASVFSFIA
jgi:hypothetical protein